MRIATPGRTRMAWREPWRCVMLAVMACVAVTVHAQGGYASRPVRLIVGFSPGGTSDALGRMLSEHLAPALGQPVVIDHRPGAASTIAAEIASRAAPDGHTLYLSSGSVTVAPSLYPKLSFDFVRDFVQVTLLAEVPFVIALTTHLPVRSVQELIAYAKPRPREVIFASSGIGTPSHLASELLGQMGGVEFTHVPYKGSGPALVDLFAGRVHFYSTNLLGSVPHIRSGKLRALAVSSGRRTATLPDVPTVEEAGYKGYRGGSWYGLALPRGTPSAIVQRYYTLVQQALQAPESKARIGDQGLDLLFGVTPEQAGAFVVQDIKRWSEVVRRAGVTLQ